METEIKDLLHSKKEIKVRVPFAEWEGFLDEAAREISKDLKINGFRPGQTPRELVLQRISEKELYALAGEKAVKRFYVKAILENKIEAIGYPKIKITRLEPNDYLEFKATVAIMPKVELADYKKIASKIKLKKAEIEEKEVDKALDYLKQSRTKYVAVRRPIRKGDRVEIDFSAFLNNQRIDNGEAKKYPLIVGRGQFVPGFEENLVGLRENAEKVFSLRLPQNYHLKDIAGKLVKFKVKVRSVQEQEEPELNDEFARSLGNFSDLKSLRQSIKKGLLEEKKQKNREIWRIEVIETIAKNSNIDLPDVLVETETEKMMDNFKNSLASSGIEFKNYLQQSNESEEKIKKEFVEQAKKRVQNALVLYRIAEKENVDISQDEIDKEINLILLRYPNIQKAEKEINLPQLREQIKESLRNERVFQLLEKYNLEFS